MRSARISFVFAAVYGALLGGPVARAADRVLGGSVPVGLRPDFLSSTAGEDETFVFATSTSSYKLSIVDTALFEDIGPLDYLAASSTKARGLAASPDGVSGGIAAVVSNDGYVDFFLVSELEDLARAGTNPNPDFFLADADHDPMSGLAIDSLGSRTWAGVPSDKTGAINTISTGLLSSTISLGHTPISVLAVNNGFTERVFFGCDDGYLAWIDTGTLAPSAVAIGGATDHMGVMATADFGGGSIRLLLLDEADDTLYVLDPAAPGTALDSAALGANAVALASSGSGASARIWVAFDDSTGGHRIEALDTTLANAQADIALAAAPRSLVERDGRLYAGLVNSTVAVISDLPFVTISSVAPDPMPVANAELSVTFTSSQSGTAKILLNDVELDSVATVASTPQTVVLAANDVSNQINEGYNRVRVEVTAAGLVGHDEEIVIFDEAPGAPAHFTVGFGDARVIGRWDPPSGANDIDHYVVYFGTSATDTNGAGTQTSPTEVNGEQYVVEVSNGTTVFMSVLAVDSGGNASARTATKSATAQHTLGAAELAGDDGGFLCSVGGLEDRAVPAFAAMLLALGALVARRALRRPETP